MSIITTNKQIYFHYSITEQYEAGIILQGWEVKAIRFNKVHIKEAHIIIRHGEIFLLNAYISPLINTSIYTDLHTTRTRKLLLHTIEINKLIGKVQRSGYTIVPICLYYAKNLIKCKIGLAKGKKQHDKRETEKKRDAQREIQAAIKLYR